ncbi:MAG TPA: hypothetical protein VJM50_12405 [Pyrinomonadaceae bacterium]|nr:hypothetical protein [Pyrinomonadaceae bacterium]
MNRTYSLLADDFPSVRGATVSYVMRYGVLTATPRTAWSSALLQ